MLSKEQEQKAIQSAIESGEIDFGIGKVKFSKRVSNLPNIATGKTEKRVSITSFWKSKKRLLDKLK